MRHKITYSTELFPFKAQCFRKLRACKPSQYTMNFKQHFPNPQWMFKLEKK